jgi:LysR family transcriptional regulator, transcriptional activator of nhaA
MIPLNLHHLYYFWTVAKEGSIAKACQKLFLSQPAISAQIIQLEKSLGKKLFERQKRRLRLTAEGELVQGYAEDIFSRSQELLDALRDRPEGHHFAIQIGIVDQVPKQVARRIVSEILRFQGDTRITVHEGTLPALLAELRAHALDLVVSDMDVPMGGGHGYIRTEIGQLQAAWVVAPAMVQHLPAFPKGLGELPLLVPTPGSPLRAEVERFFHHAQVVPRILAEIQDVELLRLMVLDGKGAAPVHLAAIEADVKAKRLYRLGPRAAAMTHPLWLLARERHRQNPIGEHLMQHFRWKEVF